MTKKTGNEEFVPGITLIVLFLSVRRIIITGRILGDIVIRQCLTSCCIRSRSISIL